ncbi:MAG: tRNA (cytidine(34)-2'-O)-methyltransferase [Opitutales bacterium]
MSAPLNIILHNPQIPQNTGNIGRLCAILNAKLHLIHPFGFTISDSKLKRAGMDYWKELDVSEYNSWEDFKEKHPSLICRTWLLTTKATQTIWEADFEFGDALIFGSEDKGAPQHVHNDLEEKRITIPQFNTKMRSLNLATSAGIASYEAMRQISSKI